MAHGSSYLVPLRRRREGKTDYKARKAMVLSRKPRFIARITNRNVLVQMAIAKPNGDEVIAAAHSRELRKKFGWNASTGNASAAYLTGLLCGLRALEKNAKEAVLDIGLVSPTKGANIFATLQGVLDAGVDVPHDKSKMVNARAKGEHITEYAKNLISDTEVFSAKFSKYLERGLSPEKLTEHFAKVKTDIINSFKKDENNQ